MSLEETKKVLPSLKQQIAQTVANLEALIVSETFYLEPSIVYLGYTDSLR